jgi:hypothetical protein
MRAFARAGAVEALPSVAGSFARGAFTACVTNIALAFCLGHNFLLPYVQLHCDRFPISVLRRLLFHVIENQHRHGALLQFQFQAELLVDSVR